MSCVELGLKSVSPGLAKREPGTQAIVARTLPLGPGSRRLSSGRPSAGHGGASGMTDIGWVAWILIRWFPEPQHELIGMSAYVALEHAQAAIVGGITQRLAFLFENKASG